MLLTPLIAALPSPLVGEGGYRERAMTPDG